MKTTKNVLIALDYNPNASKIAEIGFSFAKAMNAEITLLHVVENEVYYTTFMTSPLTGLGDFDNAAFYQYMNNDGLNEAANYYLEKIKKLHKEYCACCYKLKIAESHISEKTNFDNIQF